MTDPALLGESSSAEAGRLLARAFMDDPGTAIVEPDPERRFEVNSGLFELLVRSDPGSVWAAHDGGQLAGVAIWLAPTPADEQDGSDLIERARAVAGRDAADRWAAMLEDFERVRREAVNTPHWFLALIGVDPDLQGRGIGTSLMEVGHAPADAEGLPCVLETFTDADAAYYRRHGYEAVLETTIANGVPLKAMVRRPRSGA